MEMAFMSSGWLLLLLWNYFQRRMNPCHALWWGVKGGFAVNNLPLLLFITAMKRRRGRRRCLLSSTQRGLMDSSLSPLITSSCSWFWTRESGDHQTWKPGNPGNQDSMTPGNRNQGNQETWKPWKTRTPGKENFRIPWKPGLQDARRPGLQETRTPGNPVCVSAAMIDSWH